MQYNSNLVLSHYYVEKIVLETRQVTNELTNVSTSIQPSIQRVVESVDDDNVNIKLLFTMNDSSQVITNFQVHLVGSFHLVSWKNEKNHDLVYHNTVAILFPFLRSIIASLTTAANLPPLILPVVSTRDLFGD